MWVYTKCICRYVCSHQLQQVVEYQSETGLRGHFTHRAAHCWRNTRENRHPFCSVSFPACILKSIVIIIAIVGCRNFTSPFPHFVRSWNRLVNNGNGFLALNRRAPPLPILDLPFLCRLARLPVKRALLLDRLVKKLRTFSCCHYVTISLETICDSSSSYNRTAALKK